jgi:hypothetical protein
LILHAAINARGRAAIDVSLETLRRAIQLAGDLADLDDPAGFPQVVLPTLAAMVGCDVLTYNEIGPAPGQTRYADYPAACRRPGHPSRSSPRSFTNTLWSTTTAAPATVSRSRSVTSSAGSSSTAWACTPSSSCRFPVEHQIPARPVSG